MAEITYPDVIYFDIRDEDSDVTLEPPDNKSQKEYVRKDRGSSGVIYVNDTLDICIKLILYPMIDLDADIDQTITSRYENEVRLQTIANSNDYAPSIYRNFRTQITINGRIFDIYVIVMDYLNPETWQMLRPSEITEDIIRNFVVRTGLYNDVDPYNHFYKNRLNGQIFMIDYGHVKECKPENGKRSGISECINKMFSKFNSHRRGGGSKTKKKRKSMKYKKCYNSRHTRRRHRH